MKNRRAALKGSKSSLQAKSSDKKDAITGAGTSCDASHCHYPDSNHSCSSPASNGHLSIIQNQPRRQSPFRNNPIIASKLIVSQISRRKLLLPNPRKRHRIPPNLPTALRHPRPTRPYLRPSKILQHFHVPARPRAMHHQNLLPGERRPPVKNQPEHRANHLLHDRSAANLPPDRDGGRQHLRGQLADLSLQKRHQNRVASRLYQFHHQLIRPSHSLPFHFHFHSHSHSHHFCC